jgi:methylmalonyl-CoA mutase cobalamin-binding domain/chain
LIAVSSLSGAHRHIATELILSLREREARDIPVVMGGIIPQEDHAFLHALGIEAVFTPGAQTLPAIIQAFIELTEGTPA